MSTRIDPCKHPHNLWLMFLQLDLARDRRDASIAQNVVLRLAFGDYLSHLKLAQYVRRPHAMRLAFAHGRVVHAHKLFGRGYGSSRSN